MKYKAGYKYQLHSIESFNTDIIPFRPIETEYIKLSLGGKLTVLKGYAWDGVSGGVIDRKTNLRASLCHDALYQLMRMKKVHYGKWRAADREFSKILKQDGAFSFIIKIDMIGLRIARGRSARPASAKKIKTAP